MSPETENKPRSVNDLLALLKKTPAPVPSVSVVKVEVSESGSQFLTDVAGEIKPPPKNELWVNFGDKPFPQHWMSEDKASISRLSASQAYEVGYRPLLIGEGVREADECWATHGPVGSWTRMGKAMVGTRWERGDITTMITRTKRPVPVAFLISHLKP